MGIIGSDQKECPMCGKMFIVPVENVYKLVVKGKTKHFCSYTCFRKMQKRLGHK